MNNLDKLKNEIVYFMKRLYRQKLTTSLGGNISTRYKNLMLITPSQKDKDLLKNEDIVLIDIDTETVISDLTPSMEYRFHLSIYKKRTDVQAIIHAHPFWGTWIAITNEKPYTDILEEAQYFLKNISFCNYAPMGSETLSSEIERNINSSEILILRNHGIVSVGKNLTEALERIEVFENIAHYTYLLKTQENKKSGV